MWYDLIYAWCVASMSNKPKTDRALEFRSWQSPFILSFANNKVYISRQKWDSCHSIKRQWRHSMKIIRKLPFEFDKNYQMIFQFPTSPFACQGNGYTTKHYGCRKKPKKIMQQFKMHADQKILDIKYIFALILIHMKHCRTIPPTSILQPLNKDLNWSLRNFYSMVSGI